MSTIVVQDNQDQTAGKVVVDERANAEVVSDPEECYRRSVDLLVELGFPKGVLPLKDLVECGRNKETGYVWMKQKDPYEHYFEKTGTRVSYATEVTAYVEKGKMKRMTGVKSRQMMLWVTISEMSLEERPGGRNKIMFKTPMGIGKAFPASAFMTEDELLLAGSGGDN
ncbi:hypothetical protein MLD38_027695 [Melastoma candidum]|uniref:Uncharacterized protein n=1 Tax=Melastoma candidum TaxID=119954 RepID=A0ACB9P5F5_9MYRT|nr:hypothetical protein MLD38_027695 [Melastoma candidum]